MIAAMNLIFECKSSRNLTWPLFGSVFIVFGSASVVVAIVLGRSLHYLVVMVRASRRRFLLKLRKSEQDSMSNSSWTATLFRALKE